MILFQTLRYLWTKVHRGGGVENSQAPVGMVLCARSPLPLAPAPAPAAGQRPHKLCPTHSAKPQHKASSFSSAKNGGIRKEFEASKDFP